MKKTLRSLLMILSTLQTAGMLSAQSAMVLQTASTNLGEVRVTVPARGPVTASRSVKGAGHRMQFSKNERTKFWKALSSALPLTSLPSAHCFKSVSFGSALFVEIDGQRSPDLSCPNQPDPRASALQSSARKIVETARKQLEADTLQRPER